MNPFVPKRVAVEELLDEHDAPRADVDRSLRDLRWINRWFGGVGIYRRIVRPFAPDSILDIGTGTSDLLEGVPHVAQRIGLDFKIDHLTWQPRDRRIHRVVGDARQLPFRDRAIDVVTSAHFLHHFTPEENSAMLRESLRVARKGVAMNDTRRHYLPLLFVQVVGALRLVGRITRFDAPASVRQGYTVAEVRAFAAGSGAARTVVKRCWPFRFALLMWQR